MQRRKLASLLMPVLLLCMTAPVSATLIVRGTDSYGNRLIYDDDLDITWLDLSSGLATWTSQLDWAANLVIDFNGMTFSDWRLPRFDDGGDPACNFSYDNTNCGYNVDTATGEMAHLFYDELGNLAYYDTAGNGPQSGYGLSNPGPFTSLRTDPGLGYYYGQEFVNDTRYAWEFRFGNGLQVPNWKINNSTIGSFAIAVLDGDVLPSTSGPGTGNPIPEPATLLLIASGIAGMAATRKKHRAK